MNNPHRINTLNTLRPLVLAIAGLAAGAAWAQVTVVVEPVPTVVDPVVSARQQEMALQLARANLSQQGITEPTTAQLALATSDVQALRDSGMGWGQIANSLGLRLGAVVSAANRADKADGLTVATTTGRPATVGSKAKGGNSGNSNAGGGQGAGNSGNKGGGSNAGGGGNAGGNSGNGGKGGNSGNGGGGNGGGKGGGNGGGKR